jgi:hypothetical protein
LLVGSTERSNRYTPLDVLHWVVASPILASRAVDLAVDAARVLLLGLTISFPISLIPAGDIAPGVRQHMRTSLLPEFEGDAVRLEDFFCHLVAEVSPSLIGRSRWPGLRAWTQNSSSNRCRANIRPHPIHSFIVPHGDGTAEVLTHILTVDVPAGVR